MGTIIMKHHGNEKGLKRDRKQKTKKTGDEHRHEQGKPRVGPSSDGSRDTAAATKMPWHQCFGPNP